MKLIIINGPFGVGKTTVARALHKQLPFSFLLDLDRQRSYINKYQEDTNKSGFAMYGIGKNIIDACLEHGIDVIVDRMMCSPQFIDDLLAPAAKYNAEIHEFILWADKDTVIERAKKRGFKTATLEDAKELWAVLNRLRQKRKQAILIETGGASPKEITQKILNHVV